MTTDVKPPPRTPAPRTVVDEFVPPVTGRRRTIALLVVLLGFLLDLLDITIVNVALPSVRDGIGATPGALQWVVASYTLAFAVMLISSGRLGDIVGRKRMFLIGVAGFTVASALAGLAQSPEQLIAARFLQGAMGAAMVPQVLAIIQVLYAPAERGRAMAWLSAVLAIGTVGGPIIGALLTAANIAGWGWRTVFLVNLPVGIAAFFTARAVVPESKAPNARRLDIPGLVLITAALILLVFPIVQGRELDWPVWAFVCIAASFVVLGAFVAYERQREDSPLVPMTLFRYRSFNGGLLVSLFFMGGVMPFFLINTLFLQIGQGFSVLQAGLIGIMWGCAVPLFGAIGARVLAPRLGRWTLQIGLLLMAAAMVILIVTVRSADTITAWHMFPGLFLGGTGMGLTFAPLVGSTLNQVPVSEAGSASGVFNTVQQVGAVVGIAVCGVLFFSFVASQASPAMDRVTPQLRTELIASGLSEGQVETLVTERRACFEEFMSATEPDAAAAACLAASTGPSADWSARAIDAGYRLALERTLYYQIAAFLLAFAASFLLPRK